MALDKKTMESIFQSMLDGSSLIRSLRAHGVSNWDFYETIENDTHYSEKYARAQQMRSELLVEQTIEIADEEPDAQRARNRIDARRWYASKMRPLKYGERLDVNVNQSVNIVAAIAEAKARVLPMRDSDGIEDAQIVETKQISSGFVTGPEPVSKENPQENQGTVAGDTGDIFS